VRYFPDDNFGVDEAHIDPLERARIALDFDALAKSAPPVKEILFMAQTMGPLPNVRGTWHPRPAAFAFAICALLLLAPWLPIRSSFTVMQIGFEKTMPRADADKLSAHLMRNQPRNVLLQSEFKPSDPGQTGYNVPGHLRIHLTAFNSSEPKIEATFKDLIGNYQGRRLDPLFTVDQNVETSKLHSPAVMAYSLLKDHTPRVLHVPDQSQILAELTRKSQPLLASAVAPKIENIATGLKVKDVQFNSGANSDAQYSFRVPAWPEPVNFAVDGFEALDGERKSRVMSAAEDWVRSSNLGIEGGEIVGDVPLQVTVYGLDAEVDPVLTGKVQSWIQQPEDGGEITLAAGDELLKKAMHDAMGDQAFSSQFERRGDRLFAKVYLERFHGSVFSKPVDEAADETDTQHGEY
jgi:hypothetical protein